MKVMFLDFDGVLNTQDCRDRYFYVFFSDKLHSYLADIDEQAREMFDNLVEQIKEAEGVIEELKEQDQLEWVQRMINIQQRAREIVCSELLYV